MELTGEQKLALPRARVWEALNDPDILKRCLPGCDLFEREEGDKYKVGMTASVGPVKARFNGKLTLSDIVPPTSYALAFEGSGGAAGFGKGNARVTLSDEDGGITKLAYAVNAQVGGKLAQVGARLIDGVAKKMADEFFTRFVKTVSSETPAVAAAETATPDSVVQAATESASASTSTAAPSPAPSPAPVPAPSPAPLPTALIPAAARPAPSPSHPPAPAAPMPPDTTGRNVAVLAAAISAIGAAVAVLAAAVAMYVTH